MIEPMRFSVENQVTLARQHCWSVSDTTGDLEHFEEGILKSEDTLRSFPASKDRTNPWFQSSFTPNCCVSLEKSLDIRSLYHHVQGEVIDSTIIHVAQSL